MHKHKTLGNTERNHTTMSYECVPPPVLVLVLVLILVHVLEHADCHVMSVSFLSPTPVLWILGSDLHLFVCHDLNCEWKKKTPALPLSFKRSGHPWDMDPRVAQL